MLPNGDCRHPNLFAAERGLVLLERLTDPHLDPGGVKRKQESATNAPGPDRDRSGRRDPRRALAIATDDPVQDPAGYRSLEVEGSDPAGLGDPWINPHERARLDLRLI